MPTTLSIYEQAYINGLSQYLLEEVKRAVEENKKSFIIFLNGYISSNVIQHIKDSKLKIRHMPQYYSTYGVNYTIWKYAIIFD